MLKKIKEKYHQHKIRRAQRREKIYLLHSQPSEYDEAILSWIAPETIKHERGMTWKVVMGGLLLSGIIWGIFTNALTFSLVLAVFAVAYYLINLEHPKDLEVKISHIGIKIGTRRYPYSRIKAFWIIYEPPYLKILNLRVSGEIITDLTIQLHDQTPSAVREVLMEKIPEMEGQSEKLSDLLLRLFKI